MRVLGIETSCDETGVALVDSEQGVISDSIFSQVDIHRKYGGVVPELASRDHLKKLLPLIEEVMGTRSLDEIDAVAYVNGPGLIGALMTGAVFAQGLAMSLSKPAIGIHHMEAHLMVCDMNNKTPHFPYLALLVSGGHTLLVRVNGLGEYEILGETLDDAIGEAFDKVARMLGLEYPGGPAIEKVARSGVSGRFNFPRPMSKSKDLDFSFSGLKTKVMRTIGQNIEAQLIADIALAFEEAAIDSLIIKCRQALEKTGLERLVIVGGVAANRHLRERAQELKSQAEIVYPDPKLCTDNGIMIAYAGLLRLSAGEKANDFPKVYPRYSMQDLTPPPVS